MCTKIAFYLTNTALRYFRIDMSYFFMQNWNYMKKKVLRRTHHRAVHKKLSRASVPQENYLVVVRGWMLVVAFALMLGVGAIVGNFVNQQLNISSPTVAGVSTSR